MSFLGLPPLPNMDTTQMFRDRSWLLPPELISLFLYIILLILLLVTKSSVLKTNFFTNCWILGIFDLLCYFTYATQRVLKSSSADVVYLYSCDIFLKMMTNGHQMTMIYINVMRFRILYNPVARGVENSISPLAKKFIKLGIIFVLAIASTSQRIVLVAIFGWPDVYFNHGNYVVDMANGIYAGSVIILPCTFCVILNFVTIWKWTHDKSLFISSSTKTRNRRQLMYAVFIVITALPLTLVRLVKLYGTLTANQDLINSTSSSYDICYFPFTFGSLYLLILMNRELSGEIYRILWRKKVHPLGSITHRTTVSTTRGSKLILS